MPSRRVAETDVARASESDLESLRRRAAHPGPINDDMLVYRIECHLVESADADAADRRGPWLW